MHSKVIIHHDKYLHKFLHYHIILFYKYIKLTCAIILLDNVLATANLYSFNSTFTAFIHVIYLKKTFSLNVAVIIH